MRDKDRGLPRMFMIFFSITFCFWTVCSQYGDHNDLSGKVCHPAKQRNVCPALSNQQAEAMLCLCVSVEKTERESERGRERERGWSEKHLSRLSSLFFNKSEVVVRPVESYRIVSALPRNA